MNKYEQLKNIINESKSIVIFSGAGISVPSGIPDFRSSNGLYTEEFGQYSPEEIISHSFFIKNPTLFYKFYGSKMVYREAKPNLAHLCFAKMPNVKAVVTQNIDGLHQMAGSKNVLELHGSVHRNYCMKCHKFYPLKEIDVNKPCYCDCGGMIKPDVVLYEEPLDEEIVYKAIEAISKADTLIVVGTSLVVYPAASYLRYFRGKHLILINKSSTSYDSLAELVFNEDVIEVMKQIEK